MIFETRPSSLMNFGTANERHSACVDLGWAAKR